MGRSHPQYPQKYKALPVKGKSHARCDLTQRASCKSQEPRRYLIAHVIKRCPTLPWPSTLACLRSPT